MGMCSSCDPQDPGDYNTDPLLNSETNHSGRSRSPDTFEPDAEYSDDSSEETAPRRSTTQRVRDASFMRGFREAIKNGNASLVLFYIDENREIDFLNLEFENGSSCLHVCYLY